MISNAILGKNAYTCGFFKYIALMLQYFEVFEKPICAYFISNCIRYHAIIPIYTNYRYTGK